MRTINPLRKELVKREYLRTGGNGYKALKAGGLKESTARHCVEKNNTLLNLVKKEIAEEINKDDLIKKAYLTLKKNLKSQQGSVANTAAIAILDFNEGKKSKVDQNNLNPDKIIISYGNKSSSDDKIVNNNSSPSEK